MLAVVVLVGSEDQEGALVHAAASVEGTADGSQPGNDFRPVSQPASPRQVQQASQNVDAVGWADDADLIDDTSGFDPTPDEFDPADGDMYILEDEY